MAQLEIIHSKKLARKEEELHGVGIEGTNLWNWKACCSRMDLLHSNLTRKRASCSWADCQSSLILQIQAHIELQQTGKLTNMAVTLLYVWLCSV